MDSSSTDSSPADMAIPPASFEFLVMSLRAQAKACSTLEQVQVSELCTRLHAQLELAAARRIEARSFQAACEPYAHAFDQG